MNAEKLQALKDVHECQQFGTRLLLPKARYKKVFKELENEGFIYAYKFNTYSIALTELGINKCIELIQNRII